MGAPLAVPPVVQQALGDVQLPSMARLMMWHLAARLDFHEWREMKAASLASEMRIRDTTVGQMLTVLVARGYLDQRPTTRRSRAFRLPWSRRPIAATEPPKGKRPKTPHSVLVDAPLI